MNHTYVVTVFVLITTSYNMILRHDVKQFVDDVKNLFDVKNMFDVKTFVDVKKLFDVKKYFDIKNFKHSIYITCWGQEH